MSGRACHREEGTVALEALGYLWLFVVVVVMAFQLQAVAGAATNAENAARTGSRVAGRGGNAVAAALDAVHPEMRQSASVGGSGCNGVPTTTVTVCIDVPIVIPLMDGSVRIERSATLPARGLGIGF